MAQIKFFIESPRRVVIHKSTIYFLDILQILWGLGKFRPKPRHGHLIMDICSKFQLYIFASVRMRHQTNFHISKMASRRSLPLELKERIDYNDDEDDPELKENPKREGILNRAWTKNFILLR